MFRIKTALLACLLLVGCFTSVILAGPPRRSGYRPTNKELQLFTTFLAGSQESNDIIKKMLYTVNQIRELIVPETAKAPIRLVLFELRDQLNENQKTLEARLTKYQIESPTTKELVVQVRKWISDIENSPNMSANSKQQLEALRATLQQLVAAAAA